MFSLKSKFELFRQYLMIHFHMSYSESEFTNNPPTKSLNEKKTNHISKAIAHIQCTKQWAMVLHFV